MAQVETVPAHAEDPTDTEAYPAVHVQATGCQRPPPQETPAPHCVHGDDVPVHAAPFPTAVLAYPGAQLHRTACAEPPAHTVPAPQIAQDELAPAHAVDPMLPEEYPAVHVQLPEHAAVCSCVMKPYVPGGHAMGCAAPPVQ